METAKLTPLVPQDETIIAEVSQESIITNNIDKVSHEVKKIICDLSLDSMSASDANKQKLKKARAHINKISTHVNNARKEVKNKILKPYTELDKQIKEQIMPIIEDAKQNVGDKICEIEDRQLKQKQQIIHDYFTELCTAYKIDFIKFNDINVKVNLSISINKIKDTIKDFIVQIDENIKEIKKYNHDEEFINTWLYLFKQNLDYYKSFKQCNEQRQAIEREKERKRQDIEREKERKRQDIEREKEIDRQQDPQRQNTDEQEKCIINVSCDNNANILDNPVEEGKIYIIQITVYENELDNIQTLLNNNSIKHTIIQ